MDTKSIISAFLARSAAGFQSPTHLTSSSWNISQCFFEKNFVIANPKNGDFLLKSYRAGRSIEAFFST
jgi:hypothetical protein